MIWLSAGACLLEDRCADVAATVMLAVELQ
jgi:hypothetical protein